MSRFGEINSFKEYIERADIASSEITERYDENVDKLVKFLDILSEAKSYLDKELNPKYEDVYNDYNIDVPEEYTWFNDISEKEVARAYDYWDYVTYGIEISDKVSELVDYYKSEIQNMIDKFIYMRD